MQTQSRPCFSRWQIILIAALVAGTLDILAACVQAYVATGTYPVIVLQYIASGLIGPRSFSGGYTTAAAGLALHFLIALLFAAAWYVVYRTVAAARKNPLTGGVMLGVVMWCIMNLLVVPMSAVPGKKLPDDLVKSATGMLILVVMAGVPIALITSRLSKRRGKIRKVI